MDDNQIVLKKRVPYLSMIFLKSGRILPITGNYCPEYESNRWHYWIRDTGEMVHVTKDSIEYVEGGTEEDLIASKQVKGAITKNSGFESIEMAVPVKFDENDEVKTSKEFRRLIISLEECLIALNNKTDRFNTPEDITIHNILKRLTATNNTIVQENRDRSSLGKLFIQISSAIYLLWFLSYNEEKDVYFFWPYPDEYTKAKNRAYHLIGRLERDYENSETGVSPERA